VLEQSYGGFELLVVDDGSSDGTLDVVSSFSDPRLVVHRNERRLGLPDNWNRCLSLAAGEYVKFVFQDDTLVPAAVERLLRALEADTDAAFAFSRREIRHEGPGLDALPLQGGVYQVFLDRFYASFRGHIRGVDLVANALASGHDLTVNVVGEPSFTLLRRQAALAAGGFDGTFRQLVDWEFWLRLSCGSAIAFVDESLGMFRVHAGGASASNHLSLRVRWEFVKLLGRVRREYGALLGPHERRRLSREQWRFRRHLVGQALRAAVGN